MNKMLRMLSDSSLLFTPNNNYFKNDTVHGLISKPSFYEQQWLAKTEFNREIIKETIMKLVLVRMKIELSNMWCK